MAQLFIVAFMIGIVGSFHCVGMCGPLALALPLKSNSFGAKFTGSLLYNAGRIITYAFFGLIFGLIGQTAALFHFQQWLSIGAGVVILFFIVVPKKYSIQRVAGEYTNGVLGKLRSALGRLFSQKNQASLFVIGLLNGLLPCGLVYMAVAGAIGTGDAGSSILFMAAFGLGTLPVMWSIAFFGNYVGVQLRQKIRRVYPYLMAVMACLLILRGMGLGIPFISPEMNTEKAKVNGCCTKTDESQVLK
jgi:hypothetical protein